MILDRSAYRFAVAYGFDFSDQTVEPPTSSQLRLDAAAPYAVVSRTWWRLITNDGIDVYQVLMSTPVGSHLYVQDKNDHTAFVQMATTAAGVDKGTYVELPVTWIDGSGALNNNQQLYCAFFSPITAPVQPWPFPPGPVMDLATAKMHLRIADDLHDDDVQLKSLQAEAIIRDYLKDWDDGSTWTDWASTPGPVQAAMLIYLTHLYEHRGDDMNPTATGQTPDADVWKAIVNLLSRFRGPTVQ